MSWHQIQKIFPGLLNICAKFEEIPSTSKDAIGRQTCGAGGPFRENSSHMQTSVLKSLNRGKLKTRKIKENTYPVKKEFSQNNLCYIIQEITKNKHPTISMYRDINEKNL